MTTFRLDSRHSRSDNTLEEVLDSMILMIMEVGASRGKLCLLVVSKTHYLQRTKRSQRKLGICEVLSKAFTESWHTEEAENFVHRQLLYWNMMNVS